MPRALPLALVALLASPACGSEGSPVRSAEGRRASCDARCDAAFTDAGSFADARSDAGGAALPGFGVDASSDARGESRAYVDSGRFDAGGSCCAGFVGRLANLEHVWPLLTIGTETRSFSSFDRTGGNTDGFDGTYSALYTLANGESVIFDAIGPGVLDTLWFTGPDEGGNGLDLGDVRFYLDDESAPRFEAPWQDLFSGDHAPFLSPLVADNHTSTGGFVSFVPVPYARHLIVTTAKRPDFYQAHYETLPPDAAVTSFEPSMDVGTAVNHFQAALGATPRTDVVEVPLDDQEAGSGSIDVVQFVPATAPTDAALESARVRIFWDGETVPSVDVPLGAFFGSGLGVAEVHALAFSMVGGIYENRFVMPYWSGFHFTIEGLAGTLRIHRSASEYAQGEAGYFHAASRAASPTTPGVDFEWLRTGGAGKLVGTTLTVHPATPATKKWWEGDLRSSADGRRTPGIQGTGHEDDHLGGWSDTFFQNPFSLPMNGEPRADIIDRTGQLNANVTMYRFFPGIGFEDGIVHSTEHGNRNTVSGDYAGVAFYYADPSGTTLVETDSLDPTDGASRAAHGYSAAGEATLSTLSSSFEGPDDTTVIAHAEMSHTGRATFRVAVAAGNSGCFLRRWFDQRSGRQGAAVGVDGVAVGRSYVAEQNTTHRWAERDYFLPPRYVAEKSGVSITIDPDPGAPPWSVANYRMLCVVHGANDGG